MEMTENNERYIGTRELANMVGVKTDTIYTWLSRGKVHIKSIKIGKLRRYKLSDIKYFLKSCESEGEREEESLLPSNMKELSFAKNEN